MKSLKDLLKEIYLDNEIRKEERFKQMIRSGIIKKKDIEKEYKKLEE
jgi:hypothetical protein